MNLLLDFTHICPPDVEQRVPGMKRIDLSDIPGTCMYCTGEAKRQLRERLNDYGPHGIHFLDNGNYHYMTELFAEKIRAPFALVLFDHHSDMQQPLIHDLTSCGSWAAQLARNDSFLKQLILIGPDASAFADIDDDLKEKTVFISVSDQEEAAAARQIGQIDMRLPVYLSIDKDILDRCSARTNWNQGNMSLITLEKLLREVFAHQCVIGADICGGCDPQEPLWQLMEDERINARTDAILYRFLSRYLRPVVAFVCVHNSCRSQIAEALGRQLAADAFISCSAGTAPREHIDAGALRYMKELMQIDMEKDQYPKLIDDIPDPDIVITMGCNVSCPSIPCRHREDWGLEDPCGQGKDAYIKTILRIREKVLELRQRILDHRI